ncbi:DNA-directed RNA polymerase II subunit 4 [Stylosanthes scabra]|uniref:DNA-directed RNA polymerase II subunit 4 n=1 Tax=Stylosanthes scabra TaxID=79078 RepID=A0ABU6T711_9FABA|nr:DNA-directed RNA polymerase II subunit 4 [Stylosanthes scabra]
MSGEEEENAAELKIGEEFLKAKCLMNCEVSLILEHKYEQLQQTSDDPMNQVSQVFEKSLQYVKRFSRYKNPDAVRQVREAPSYFGVKDGWVTMDEFLKTRGRAQDDEAIEKMLNDLSLIKKFE